MRNVIPKYPRTMKEARARSLRAIEAVELNTRQKLIEVAMRWDEGAVSTAVDEAMDGIVAALGTLRATIDEEVAARAEEAVPE